MKLGRSKLYYTNNNTNYMYNVAFLHSGLQIKITKREKKEKEKEKKVNYATTYNSPNIHYRKIASVFLWRLTLSCHLLFTGKKERIERGKW